MKTTICMAFLAGMIAFSSLARAENNQTLVLGGGIGYHIFADIDENREGNDSIDSYEDIGAALSTQLFAEWFVFGNFGLGFVANSQYARRTYELNDSTNTQEWNIRHYFITLNVVPLGGESYGRLGIFVGAGPSVYAVTRKSDDSEDIAESVTGTASTLGMYVDWGGKSFGVRVGYQFIATSYPELEINTDNKYDVSASGSNLHFALRWAF